MRQSYKTQKIKDLYIFLVKDLKIKDRIILKFSNKMIYRGSYSYFTKIHYITLNRKDNYYTLIDSLIHEIAHCLDKNFDRNEHSYIWGKKFAKVYRSYLKWDKMCN